MDSLKALHDQGVSIWLDNIRRNMLNNGKLERYIHENSVTGLTSNPTIFEHAIAAGDDYDETIRRHLNEASADFESIFFELALEDLTRAADLFALTYKQTNASDGFVSLELSPELADKTQASIEQARELAGRANRPNLLIKVPGTPAGIPAIEQLIYEGIPVNVTLLFSAKQYEAAAEAYLRGLERRHEENLPLRVPSVASLFISRWDKATEGKLPQDLQNQLGIAVGRQAYCLYSKILQSARWKKLAEAGALPQRLLWASTGTKDPSLPEDYYVAGLTAMRTVNTMPEETLLAFAKSGRPGDPLPSDSDERSESTLKAISEAGIDVAALATQLQEEGKRKFSVSYHDLLARIEKKISQLRETDEPEQEHLGDLDPEVQQTRSALLENNAVERIWRKDHTLWNPDPTEISNRLGWLDSPRQMLDELPRLHQFVDGLRQDGFTHVLWSGMGGSSLFPQVMQRSFPDASGLAMTVLDTSNPVTIRTAAENIPAGKTLYVFASKSGGTLETRSHLDYFWSLDPTPSRYAVVTDKGSELAKIGSERNFREVFYNNPDIGGRYSALSHFGLVAAALLGIDIRELLTRAQQMMLACGAERSTELNPGLLFGSAIGTLAKAGKEKLTLILPAEIESFGMWLEQLIAESTGKQDIGILPIAGEPIGRPEAYGEDRTFVCLGGESDRGELGSLRAAGHPVIHLPFVDRYSIGAECFRWEFAIAVAGKVLGINPFNQPNVEAAKKAAGQVLSEGLPDIPVTPCSTAFKQIHHGDYVALQAYLDLHSPQYSKLEQLRVQLRDHYQVGTTIGFGPRYLHSTGQLHKGGKANGVFLQVIDDLKPDLEVPGRQYTFGQLFEAQAAGDYMALKDRNRRVYRVALSDLLQSSNDLQ